jgi:hypothetical protein
MSIAARLLPGLGAVACSLAQAQSVEPRAYSPAPVGVNFLVAAYAATRGGFPEDTALQNPRLTVQGPVFAYARTFELAGRLAKFDAVLPTARLSGSADFQGQLVEREATGLMDPLLRVSVNLAGAPAMDVASFRAYEQDTVIGASLQVSLPLGDYDGSRLVNLGTNRWSFHPEAGVSKAFGRWVAELAGGAIFYTANDDYFGGHNRRQDPVYTARANLIYNFRSGPWISVDTSYYAGGATSVDGQPGNDLQRNWRIGTTLAFPIDRRLSFKVNASRGVSARTGNNFDLLGAALQYRWGGGI